MSNQPTTLSLSAAAAAAAHQQAQAAHAAAAAAAAMAAAPQSPAVSSLPAGLLPGSAANGILVGGGGVGGGGGGGQQQQQQPGVISTQPTVANSAEGDKICQCINDLLNPNTREAALMELSRKRESVSDLAVMLWHSFGAITALLQEIIAIYPTIHPPSLSAHQSNRVCNALALLQCVASHPDTRNVFLQANIPLYLYPFLNMHTSSKTRPFEYLRLTSLGVIGALVKTDEKEVINFLLKTEIIPLCLRIMESGTELSKTVATFILQKILLDETGLNYICQTYDRFSHVAMILAKMVIALSKEQSARLLKHVIRCYLRLSDNPRAREALRQCLPDQLKNNTFMACLKDDRTTKNWLMQLLKNIETKPGEQPPQPQVQPPQNMMMMGSGGGGGGSATGSGTVSPAPNSLMAAAAAAAAAAGGGGSGNVVGPSSLANAAAAAMVAAQVAQQGGGGAGAKVVMNNTVGGGVPNKM